MDFLCVRLAWSNAPGSVALLLRPPFSSSCVRISHATPLESAAACVNEYASFQWCITPHLALRIRVCLSSNGNFTLFFADPQDGCPDARRDGPYCARSDERP